MLKQNSRSRAGRLPNFNRAREYALDLLARKLPPGLAYHGLQHTRDHVLPVADKLCRIMNISPDQQLLITTAALFHDTGFIHSYLENEGIGAEIAAAALPEFGYRHDQIAAIQKMIMATRMPQQPESEQEEILCDADLGSLGRSIFFETGMMLRREEGLFLQPVSLRRWYEQQYVFLEQHRYFTRAARQWFDRGKQENLAQLERLLCDCCADNER
jgi:uncharacterized protein